MQQSVADTVILSSLLWSTHSDSLQNYSKNAQYSRWIPNNVTVSTVKLMHIPGNLSNGILHILGKNSYYEVYSVRLLGY